MDKTLTIGRVARQAGVNVETVRYYQQRGLVPEPAKPLGSFRRYSPGVVQRIQYIKRAQTAGFSLDEIALLLTLVENQRDCQQVRELIHRKRHTLRAQIETLQQRLEMLEALLKDCPQHAAGVAKDAQSCAVIRYMMTLPTSLR